MKYTAFILIFVISFIVLFNYNIIIIQKSEIQLLESKIELLESEYKKEIYKNKIDLLNLQETVYKKDIEI
jgi:hypothetical protein